MNTKVGDLELRASSEEKNIPFEIILWKDGYPLIIGYFLKYKTFSKFNRTSSFCVDEDDLNKLIKIGIEELGNVK